MFRLLKWSIRRRSLCRPPWVNPADLRALLPHSHLAKRLTVNRDFRLYQERLDNRLHVSSDFSDVPLSDLFNVLTGGSPPPDRTKVVYELMSVSLPLFIFMAVVTSLAMLISLFFLWFNITKRNVRYDVMLVMIWRNSGVLVYHNYGFRHKSNLFSFVCSFPVFKMNAQTRDDLYAFGSPNF